MFRAQEQAEWKFLSIPLHLWNFVPTSPVSYNLKSESFPNKMTCDIRRDEKGILFVLNDLNAEF